MAKYRRRWPMARRLRRAPRVPKPIQAVSLTVGGVPVATPLPFLGIPSGFVGVTQVNFTIPTNAPLGPQPVVVTVGSASSLPAYITVTN